MNASPTPLRIILADDHPVVLMGAKMALAPYTIVAQAHTADELIEQLESTPCDILITDYSMPYGRFPDGLALTGDLKRHFAQVQVIVMTMLRHPSLLQALLHGGVCGIFDKRSPLGELVRAVQTVNKGRVYLSPSFAGILQARTLACAPDAAAQVNLTKREIEVVRLFVQGLSGRQIAGQLNRSEKTISRQKRTAMDKLGVIHDSELVEFALINGLSHDHPSATCSTACPASS